MRKLKHERRSGQSNKGSAIITVVITMMFVLALGATLIFAAYTGYSIEITQRGDKENFYDASSAMDDMRLGVQTLFSDAIKKAYTGVLAEYTGMQAADYDPQADFNNRITGLLSDTKTDDGEYYFTSSLVGGKIVITGCNAAAMATLIDTQAQAYSKVTGGGTVYVSSSSALSIKAISVKFIKNGFESNITADIAITMPDFFASSSFTSGINNYAIIADNSLTESSGGNVTVNGDVFTGSSGLTVSGNGNNATFTNGDLISKGPIIVDNSAAFTFSSSSNELWADEIKIGYSGTASLDGNIYVADDLALEGAGASATLKNTYFGFGDSTDFSGDSSSILINGRNSKLDISGLSKLSLAGVSFIDISGEELFDSGSYYGTPITMGESMSVKSDQLAYLVPVNCISNYTSNPCVFDNTSPITPTVIGSTVLWGSGANAKTLSYYIDGKGEIKTLYKNMDSRLKIAYVFLVFSEKQYANEYFQDYFAAAPGKIEQYLNLYLTSLSDKANNAEINTAGNTFYTTAGGTLTLEPASDIVLADGAKLRYDKMTSPYTTFVNADEMAALGTALGDTVLIFKNTAGDSVAVVSTADNYAYTSSSSDNIRLIISSKNVSIEGAYTGIVMAGNNVTISRNVTGAVLDTDILNSTCTVSDTTYKLSDFINNSKRFVGTSTESKDLWDLDSLVFYENWTKG